MNKLMGDISARAQVVEPLLPQRPSLERRRLRAYLALVLADIAVLHAGFILAGLVYVGVWMEWRALMQAQLLLPIYFTIALYNGTYSMRVLTDWRYGVGKAVIALVISAALLNFVAFYTKSNATFSRATFTLGLIFSMALVVMTRRLTTELVSRLWNGRVQNRLVLIDGGPDFTLDDGMNLSARELAIAPDIRDPHMLDRLGRLLHNQDQVVVTCPPERRQDWALVLKSAGVQGEIVSEPAQAIGVLGVQQYDQQQRTTFIVSIGPLGLRRRAVKRAFDLAMAAGGLLLASPVLLLAALAIKLEDGGPVLFVQQRLGRGNRFFNMYKLRTMRSDGSDHAGRQSTERNDKRVTRIGAYLRSTSIDELPQLWNVLRGEMSIVGPRPHALGSRANDKLFWEVDEHYWRRHSLRPGLTGLAQVRGYRGATEREEDLTQRLQSDLEYLSGWSLLRDIQIVWRTLRVLRHDRAY